LLDATDVAVGAPVPFPFDITGAAASPDGRFFTVGRLGGFVDLYAASGELITRLEVRDTAPAGTTGPSFTDEGRFVSASVFNKEGKIALWSTDTLERLDFHVGSDWTTAKLAGSWLAVNRGGSSILLIDPASSEPVGDPLLNTAGRVTSVVIDAEAARLAAPAGDTVTAWDLESGLQLGRELPARPLSIEYCADGTILIVPGEGRLSSTESANSSTRSQLTPVYTAVPRFDPGSPASLDHLEKNGYVVIAYDVSESTGHPGGRRSVARSRLGDTDSHDESGSCQTRAVPSSTTMSS
jgi:hypothetical protein